MKVSVFTLDSERARPSSGLSENQSGFIIFTIQIVKQICKYTNTQIHKYINTQIQIQIHKYKYNMCGLSKRASGFKGIQLG